MTSTAYDIRTGSHITGSYMGTPFAGIVSLARTNTMNHRIVILHVELDTETVIDGLPRTAIAIDIDGQTGRDTQYGSHIDL